MGFTFDRRETAVLAWGLLKWSLLGSWVGLLAGVASAIFLHSLDWASHTQTAVPALLFGLPLAGVLIAFVYRRFGTSVEGGNNLLLERIQDPSRTVPFRMAPLILVTTVATHLFGGSAGREGTAVQMGGTLGQLAVGPLHLGPAERRVLIMAGIAGGFGAVFGTPLAGTIFGLEVLALGRLRYDALVPCLAAALVGDFVCRGLGITHHNYHPPLANLPEATPTLCLWAALAAVLFAVASVLFVELTHAIQHQLKSRIRVTEFRPFLGGLALIGLTLLVGNRDYNGLGLPLIERSFLGPVVLGAFLLKILFTSVTLGSGFKGGEVTPLFCIGATAGNAFAQVTHQPTPLFAALGFASVFAAAANTPLACIVMGVELFGSHIAAPMAVSCVLAYVLSGHRGIYGAQRVHIPKGTHIDIPADAMLRELRSSPLTVRLPQVLRRDK